MCRYFNSSSHICTFCKLIHVYTFNYYKFIVFQPHVKMFYNNNNTVLLIIRNNIGKALESPTLLGLRRITLPSFNTQPYPSPNQPPLHTTSLSLLWSHKDINYYVTINKFVVLNLKVV